MSLGVTVTDFEQAVYSRRYPRVRVFAEEAAARVHARVAFAHVGRFAKRVEADGSYLYSADAEGFAAGSPLVGWAVAATEVTEGAKVYRDNAQANLSETNRRWK